MTIIGTVLFALLSDSKFLKYKWIIIVLGSAIILIGMASNYFKEQIVEKENKIESDSLKKSNEKLLDFISADAIKKDSMFLEYKTIFEKSIDSKEWKNVEPDIIGLKPIIYKRERTELKFEDWQTPVEYGIYFILHIKGGSKPIAINGLKIIAKQYLDLQQYLLFDEVTVNRTIDDIEKERIAKRPYIMIDWDAYISDKTTIRNLYPNQMGYFGFALLEHALSGQAEGGWELPKTKYLGFDDGSLKPNKIRKYPDFTLLFSDFRFDNFPPQKIRDGFEFYVILDSKEYLIKKDKIMFVDRISDYEWQKDSFDKMYIRYFAE